MPPDVATDLGKTLSALLALAWLLPLVGFSIEIFGGFWGTRKSKLAAYIAVACIGTAFVLSASALLYWKGQAHFTSFGSHHGSGHDASHAGDDHAAAEQPAHPAAAHAEEHPVAAGHPEENAHAEGAALA